MAEHIVGLKRTDYCAELGEADTDLYSHGWCHKSRDLGGLTFITLRDRTVIQLVVSPESNEDVRSKASQEGEFVLACKGLISEEALRMLT